MNGSLRIKTWISGMEKSGFETKGSSYIFHLYLILDERKRDGFFDQNY